MSVWSSSLSSSYYYELNWQLSSKDLFPNNNAFPHFIVKLYAKSSEQCTPLYTNAAGLGVFNREVLIKIFAPVGVGVSLWIWTKNELLNGIRCYDKLRLVDLGIENDFLVGSCLFSPYFSIAWKYSKRLRTYTVFLGALYSNGVQHELATVSHPSAQCTPLCTNAAGLEVFNREVLFKILAPVEVGVSLWIWTKNELLNGIRCCDERRLVDVGIENDFLVGNCLFSPYFSIAWKYSKMLSTYTAFLGALYNKPLRKILSTA